MKDFLLLRLDAPLLSFGGPAVDSFGVVQDFPSLSLLTGLLGNALGYEHREAEKLQALQERLRYAVRRDRAGRKITDFQTVDLGQDFLTDTGWTTRGVPEERAGASSEGTHIRYREYWADSVYTLVLTLAPQDAEPTLPDLERALEEPERPLFLGRKSCLPAAPVLLGRRPASSLYEALSQAPPLAPKRRAPKTGPEYSAWWPEEEGAGEGDARLLPANDARDWKNQIHVGRRLLWHGRVKPQEAGDER